MDRDIEKKVRGMSFTLAKSKTVKKEPVARDSIADVTNKIQKSKLDGSAIKGKGKLIN